MRYITANKIHDGNKFLPEPSCIVLNSENFIEQIAPLSAIKETTIEHFPGTICPGFVNVHCHLELSHTKDVIPENTHLVPFLKGVIFNRSNCNEAEKMEIILKEGLAMHQKGCVAVGDISNTKDMVSIRPQLNMHFYTFIETMGFVNEQAEARFSWAKEVFNAFESSKDAGSLTFNQNIVPHAPYSVSEALFGLINQFSAEKVISIHNEETAAENEYYRYETGQMDELYEALNIPAKTCFTASGKTSLQTYLPWIDKKHPLLLIHNTFMETDDIALLQSRKENVYLGLCPNANWYIERRFPDVPALYKSGLSLCIGTDSLASNHQLDVYAEVRTLLQHFPEISLETMLQWATSNGAKALNLANKIGVLKAGYAPGLVNIKPDNTTSLVVSQG